MGGITHTTLYFFILHLLHKTLFHRKCKAFSFLTVKITKSSLLRNVDFPESDKYLTYPEEKRLLGQNVKLFQYYFYV